MIRLHFEDIISPRDLDVHDGLRVYLSDKAIVGRAEIDRFDGDPIAPMLRGHRLTATTAGTLKAGQRAWVFELDLWPNGGDLLHLYPVERLPDSARGRSMTNDNLKVPVAFIILPDVAGDDRQERRDGRIEVRSTEPHVAAWQPFQAAERLVGGRRGAEVVVTSEIKLGLVQTAVRADPGLVFVHAYAPATAEVEKARFDAVLEDLLGERLWTAAERMPPRQRRRLARSSTRNRGGCRRIPGARWTSEFRRWLTEEMPSQVVREYQERTARERTRS